MLPNQYQNSLEYSIKIVDWFQINKNIMYIMYVYIIALAMESKFIVPVVQLYKKVSNCDE